MEEFATPSPSWLKKSGLKWGMPPNDVIATIGPDTLYKGPRRISINWQSENKFTQHICHLFLGEENQLQRINIELLVSREFWEDYTFEEMEAITKIYEQVYEEMIVYYDRLLGNPIFSGIWRDTGYPEDQDGWKITYWDIERSFFQVELDHPDKELPIVVRVSWYPKH